MIIKVICWDLDNTLHDNREGYKDGTMYGQPMEGAVFTTTKLAEAGYGQVILTAREPSEWSAVQRWLHKYGFPQMEVTNVKPSALAYIDNKAIRFISMPDIAAYFL